MREIKFRAWNKKLKKMVYPNCKGTIIEFNGTGTEFYIKDTRYLHEGELLGFNLNSELMQYTGIKDKNGKEIYEGDIYKMSYIATYGISKGNECTDHGEIIWDNNDAGFYPLINFGMNGFISTKNVEIIGNIYENPELLEKQHD